MLYKFERRQLILDTGLGLRADCKGPSGPDMSRAPWSICSVFRWAWDTAPTSKCDLKELYLTSLPSDSMVFVLKSMAIGILLILGMAKLINADGCFVPDTTWDADVNHGTHNVTTKV